MTQRSKRYGKAVSVCMVLLVIIVSGIAYARSGVNTTFSKIGRGLNLTPDAPDGVTAVLEVPASKDMSGFMDTGAGGSAPTEATATTSFPRSPDMLPATEGARTDASGTYGDTDTGDSLRTGSLMPRGYQSPLTAGQVDDNAKFQEYLDYLRRHGGEYAIPMDVSQRLFLRVMDGEQKPVAGARVQLYDGQRLLYDGQTVSDGRVLFFPSLVDANQVQSLRAVVTRGNTAVEADVKVSGPEQTITLSDLKDNDGPVALDLVFLLDATGSMSDEIAEIKATVGSIAQRIEQLPGSTAPRFGLVAFRDRGDDYVTRSWDFTSDISRFGMNLSNVSAGGGGDTPESVNAGLYEAINLPGWADNSTGRHLRMIVLVGDAPPHIDYSDDYSYPDLLSQAVAKGIKVFPIGASNLDSGGEYIFRQFAQVTQGQFVFLTYANGVAGAPGASTVHDVPEDFSVQNLDSLVVRLVEGEVANQTGQQVQSKGSLVVPVTATVAKPIEQSATFLSSLKSTFDRATRELFSWSTLFWLGLLAGMLLVAQRIPQRARVASGVPATVEQAEAVEEDIIPDEEEEASWDEQYVPLPFTSTPHTPYIDYAAPQLTVPLPSLEAAMREHKELVAASER